MVFKKGDKTNLGRKGYKQSKEHKEKRFLNMEEQTKKRIETRRKNGWFKDRKDFVEKMREIVTKCHSNKENYPNYAFNNKHHNGSHAMEKNSNWKGGKSFEEYPPEFNEKLRDKIRKRDNNFCQLCYNTSFFNENPKEKLHIHHIDYNKKNNDEDNLICLCRNCHVQTNFDREKWQKKLSEKIKFQKENPVSIIMPVRNNIIETNDAIESIVKNTGYSNWELIIIESESTDKTDELCDLWQEEYSDRIRVFHTKKEGITKAINKGIKEAGNNDVMLTQNDVILPNLYGRDWLTEMVKGIKKEKCGIVTTIHAGGTAGQLYVNDFQWAGTWSLLIPRTTLNKIGNFDENFSPGPGDDIDFSYRVAKAGLRIYIANFWVDHHRQTENFNDNLEFRKMQNAGYFRKKHSIKPSWSAFSFDGEDFLLDDRTTTTYGCFREHNEIDDPATMLEIKKITKDFKAMDTTIDVGANTGLMSLIVQKGKVLAFEPTPETYDILKNNAIINEWKSIQPINEAVYDKKVPYMVRYATLHGIPWMGMNKIEENKEGKKITVMLDDYLDKIKRVRLIKIDTETSDLEVLKGASKILDRDSPILITEDVKEDEEYLKEKGYKFIKKVSINSIWEKK